MRAVWFVITLPFRVIFWLLWQIRRGVLAIVAASQRRFGQRTTLLFFAGLMGLFGLGLVVGFVDCQPRNRGCIDGWEIPQGILFAAFAAYLAWVAFRKVPNVKESNVSAEFDYLRYDSKDWELSWSSVALVATLVVATALILWVVVANR